VQSQKDHRENTAKSKHDWRAPIGFVECGFGHDPATHGTTEFDNAVTLA
jgi:hypothetical protein